MPNKTPLRTLIFEKAERIQDELREFIALVEMQDVAEKSAVEYLVHGEITRDTANRRRELGLDVRR